MYQKRRTEKERAAATAVARRLFLEVKATASLGHVCRDEETAMAASNGTGHSERGRIATV
jgi:hypothetical protein